MNNTNASAISVTRFLSDGTQQFIIPEYQRRYAWQEKQVLDLFYDIHYLEKQQTHLLGMTLTIREREGYPSLISVVDGQQRITTLIIMIKVLFDSYKNIGGENTRILSGIERLLYAGDNDDDTTPKIKLGKLDSADFDKIINDQQISPDIETSNLIVAYNCLKEKIEKLNINQIEEYWKKLQTKVAIIDYKLDKSTDAYKIFEITNNRGLDLTKTDIIKNFILGHISIILDAEGKSSRLKNVLVKWQKIIINLDGIKKDEFFRQYFMAKTKKKIPYSKLVESFKEYYFFNVKEVELLTEYKRYVEEKNQANLAELTDNYTSSNKKTIEKFLDELINGSLLYRKIIKAEFENNKINNEINDLNKVEAKPSYTYLLHVFSDEKIKSNDKIKLIKFLQIFMLRRQIAKRPTGELDDFFSKLCSYDAHNFQVSIYDEIDSKTSDPDFFPTNEIFENAFSEYNFSTNRAKYVLGKIENYLVPLGEKIIDWDQVQLEHIIPQKINNVKFGDWINYLGRDVDKHKKILNNIGNLTLLKDKLNLDASNNSFNQKKKKYGHSTFEITKKLSKKHSFKIKDVKLRSEQLASYAIKIWPR